MVCILICWIYITAGSYAIGTVVHTLIGRYSKTGPAEIANGCLVCITGLLTTLFIASLLCLFMPLALGANGILLVTGILCCVFNRRGLAKQWKTDRAAFSTTPLAYRLLFLLFVVIFCQISYQASSHYDDGLYYSTSIKWLQEYGTVKGLANINPRIAFNSSWLMLQALDGFSFLKVGLLNDLNGLIFLYTLLYAMGGMLELTKGNRSLSVIMRSLFILPAIAFHRGATSDWMMFNVNFLESATADLPVCLLVWIIFILFLESAKAPSKSSLVLLYSLAAVTIKLSAAPVLLLPLFLIGRQRKIKPVLLSALCALLITAPWLIRNVLLSGYLFFPFSQLDLFRVPWKIPLRHVVLFENAVMVVAADPAYPFGIPFVEPLMQWFPKWFPGLRVFQKLFFLLSVLASAGLLTTALIAAVRRKADFFRKYIFEIVFVITAVCGIFFWLLKAPDFRFGYGFISIYGIFFLSVVLKSVCGRKIRTVGWFSVIFITGTGVFYYSHEWIVANKFLLIKPLPYRMPESATEARFPDGTIIRLVSREDSWNAPLPVANEPEFRDLQPRMMGKSIKDGFYSAGSVPALPDHPDSGRPAMAGK